MRGMTPSQFQPAASTALSLDAEKRLRRLRALAWFLDRSVSLGKDRRIGVDPLIGLVPVLGDWVGAVLSAYVVYEGARLGLPWAVLTKMTGNILVETLVGYVPVAGDIFDFVWQSNTRNLRLVERHYRPHMKGRPLGRIFVAVGLMLFLCFAAIIAVGVLIARLIWAAFN
jgi:hypothetical protein